MIYLILLIPMIATVVQNVLYNTVSKSALKEKGDSYYFNIFGYLVCVTLFGAMSFSTGVSIYTFLIGILFGVCILLSSVFKMQALKEGPMHITILVTTASMIIPTLSGAVMFGEPLSIPKLIAVAILIFFIYLSISTPKGDVAEYSIKWAILCLITFVFLGAIGVIQKLHQSSPHKGEAASFLAVAFICSIIFAVVMSKKQKTTKKQGKQFYIISLACGACYFTMHYLNLKLSGIVPSQILFPVVNGSAVILSSVASVVFFKEKITKRQLVGLIGGLASLIGICFA